MGAVVDSASAMGTETMEAQRTNQIQSVLTEVASGHTAGRQSQFAVQDGLQYCVDAAPYIPGTVTFLPPHSVAIAGEERMAPKMVTTARAAGIRSGREFIVYLRNRVRA
jgi:hypothetical protein